MRHKFNVGDVVDIVNNGNKPSYNKALGCFGKVVKIKTYMDQTDYYVRIDNMRNESQEEGLFVCKENMLQSIYDYFQRVGITLKMKGEKEMKLLELYKERQLKKIDEEFEKRVEIIKKSDVKYKEFVSLLNSMQKLGDVVTISTDFKFSDEINRKIKELGIKKEETESKLYALVEEVYAHLDICENYEQKITILTNYHIIDDSGMLIN